MSGYLFQSELIYTQRKAKNQKITIKEINKMMNRRMTRLEQELSGALGDFWKQNAEKEINKIWDQASQGEILLTEDRAAYWKASGNFLPSECIEKLMHTPYKTVISAEATARAREKQDKKVIERYRQAQAKRSTEQRAEEMAEMRAAFGTGSTIVDILTGEQFEI